MDLEQLIYSDWTSFSMTLLGIILGGLITWFFARKYNKEAAKDLENESSKLRKLSDLILYKLQYPDAETEIKFDDDGNVVGLKVNMSGKASLSVNASGKISGDSGQG